MPTAARVGPFDRTKEYGVKDAVPSDAVREHIVVQRRDVACYREPLAVAAQL